MIHKIDIDTMNTLSLTELDSLRFIDNNKKLVLQDSIHILAKRMFVSTATILRLCKKIGYSGFSELKYAIKEELKIEEERMPTNMTFENVLDIQIKTIIDSTAQLTREIVEETVALMLKAKRVHFFGKGLSSTILLYASKLLLTAGVYNILHEDTHIAYLACEKANPLDLFFFCSLSGNTHQLVRAAQIAKSRGAKIISFTANVKNELSKIADVSFGISTDREHFRALPGDITSRVPFLVIFNILFAMFIVQRDSKADPSSD